MILRLLALLFAAAPFVFATMRAVSTGSDLRMLWMACAALLGAAVVLGVSKARGSRVTSVAIFIVGTLLAVLTGYLLGATAFAGIVPVSVVLAFCFAASHALAMRSRVRKS
jgi:hypothetical protein